MSEQVKVTCVIDGDTFEGKRVSSTVPPVFFGGPPKQENRSMRAILDGLERNSNDNDETFRLLDLDTPEKGESGYEDAKNALKELIDGQEVMVEGEVKDDYGRTLVKVTKQGSKARTLTELTQPSTTIDVNATMEEYDKKHYK